MSFSLPAGPLDRVRFSRKNREIVAIAAFVVGHYINQKLLRKLHRSSEERDYKADVSRKAAKTKPETPAEKPVAPAPATKEEPAPKPKPAPIPVAKKPAKPTPAAKKAAPKPAPESSRNAKATGFALDDIHIVKALIGRVGSDTLKNLIDLLSK